ncbi:MAG: membrane protein insertion efficiency factor YidD [Nitrospinota bacterium]
MILVALAGAYQRGVSPFLPPRCRFEPSCSQYARESLERYPLHRALGHIIWRLLRCQPFNAGGYDPLR